MKNFPWLMMPLVMISGLLPVAATATAEQPASDFTVKQLYNYCRKGIDKEITADSKAADVMSTYLCAGEVRGVIMISAFHETKRHPPIMCVPDNWTVQQGAHVFMKWAAANPEKWDINAEIGVFESHVKAFPCQ